MKLERGLSAITLLAAMLCWFGTASAQSSPAASPTATPIPSSCAFQDCAPQGTPVDCRTGTEAQPSLFGVSGGNYNSISNGVCCTGTFGALVQDTTGNQYALSANHVLARASSTTKSAKRNELIVQPGLLDLGCWQDSGDQVAKLSSWVPLNFTGKVNTVDCAIAKVESGGMDPTGYILNVGTIGPTSFPVSSLVDAMYVMKMGRATCLTLGQVDAIDAMGKVTYVKGGNAVSSGVATFDHQILVEGAAGTGPGAAPSAFTQPGDSGAIVLTAPAYAGSGACPQAIGLIFASNTGGTIAAVNPIDSVLSALKVSLVGQCVASSQSATQSQFLAGVDGPSAALRSSREQVRMVKENNAARLLKLDEVVAVGIGAGEDSDHAALMVYVQNDPSKVGAKIPSRIGGVQVTVKQAAGGFRSELACGTSPFSPP
jgi:hypothetical protein